MGTARGRTYSQDALAEKFAHAFFPRTANRYGCVTLHRHHFYVEEGLPKTPIFLWIYGEQLRAVFDNVVLAEYRCRYDDGQAHEVADIREGQFYATRFASPQGALIPWTPQESLVVYRARSRRRCTLPASPAGPLCLFELLSTG